MPITVDCTRKDYSDCVNNNNPHNSLSQECMVSVIFPYHQSYRYGECQIALIFLSKPGGSARAKNVASF